MKWPHWLQFRCDACRGQWNVLLPTLTRLPVEDRFGLQATYSDCNQYSRAAHVALPGETRNATPKASRRVIVKLSGLRVVEADKQAAVLRYKRLRTNNHPTLWTTWS